MIVTNRRLDWDSTYEIVLELMEQYPDAALDDIGLEELKDRIIALPSFSDDPDLVNDSILRAILREWYEETAD